MIHRVGRQQYAVLSRTVTDVTGVSYVVSRQEAIATAAYQRGHALYGVHDTAAAAARQIIALVSKAAEAEPVRDMRRLTRWKCKICGEVTIAETRPAECPFCGSAGTHVVPAEQQPNDPNDMRGVCITRSEREHLKASIKAEMLDAARYQHLASLVKASRDAASHHDLAESFVRLSEAETEHGRVFEKLYRSVRPDTDEDDDDDEDDEGDAPVFATSDRDADYWLSIAAAEEAEPAAGALYASYARTATNARLREVWAAISQVECDHAMLLARDQNIP